MYLFDQMQKANSGCKYTFRSESTRQHRLGRQCVSMMPSLSCCNILERPCMTILFWLAVPSRMTLLQSPCLRCTLENCMACCTSTEFHCAPCAACCAATTKACVAMFRVGVQFPASFLLLHFLPFALLFLLLHSVKFPLCFCCCIACNFHYGLCRCILCRLVLLVPSSA